MKMEAVHTGYEVYTEDGTIDLQASMDMMVKKLEERNPGKYSSFLRSLQKIQKALSMLWVKHPHERAEVVRLVYFAMRLIDDIVDGDTPYVFAVEERDAIVQEKKKTMRGINEVNQKDLFDMLKVEISVKGDYINETKQIIQGVEELMESMAFDARRIRYRKDNKKLEKKTREELDTHFHQLDVEGTIYPTSALFGLEPKMATRMLSPLGYACRTAYTLMDLLEDPKHGLLNIPLEDLEKFEISDDDIDELVAATSLEELPRSVKKWCASMIGEMDYDVATYQYNMDNFMIPLTYTKNPLIIWGYHLMLKKKILPTGYMGDINEIRERYAPIVEEVSRLS